MQVTSSLLRNLLDVTEEVQQAQIEIRNLVKTSFSSPSGITPPPQPPRSSPIPLLCLHLLVGLGSITWPNELYS
jgi:hypothetical protein